MLWRSTSSIRTRTLELRKLRREAPRQMPLYDIAAFPVLYTETPLRAVTHQVPHHHSSPLRALSRSSHREVRGTE